MKREFNAFRKTKDFTYENKTKQNKNEAKDFWSAKLTLEDKRVNSPKS